MDKNNLLLRGCVLRNTTRVAGLVVYAGSYVHVHVCTCKCMHTVNSLEPARQPEQMELSGNVYTCTASYIYTCVGFMCTCACAPVFISLLWHPLVCMCRLMLEALNSICSTTGHQTKALLNNSGPKAKRSKLEKDINVDVLSLLIMLLVICIIGSVGMYAVHITGGKIFLYLITHCVYSSQLLLYGRL